MKLFFKYYRIIYYRCMLTRVIPIDPSEEHEEVFVRVEMGKFGNGP